MILLIASLSLVIAGLVFWYFTIPTFLSFSVGTGLSIILGVTFFRYLSIKSRSSLLARALFSAILSYKHTTHVILQSNDSQEDNVNDENYHQIILVLKDNMGFKSVQAKEAARYAVSEYSDKGLEVQLENAIKYMGNGHKSKVRT